MATYLLTWNPKAWEWKDLDDCIFKIEQHGSVAISWSVGNTKRIQSGDRFFLMQLGTPAKGIIGGGYFLFPPFYGPHWNREPGRETLFCEIELNMLSKPENYLVSLTTLQNRFPDVKWTPQASGVSLQDSIVAGLEDLIGQNQTNAQNQKTFLEGALHRGFSNRRERSAKARQACLEHHGYDCAVCGFNFGHVYGQIGEGLIHVHHLELLAGQNEKIETDAIRDLRPVCANCHAVIHRRQIPLSIEELRRQLKR